MPQLHMAGSDAQLCPNDKIRMQAEIKVLQARALKAYAALEFQAAMTWYGWFDSLERGHARR